MKTRINLSTIAGMAFTTAALFVSGVSVNANETGVQSALENLEKLNVNIENSIRYTAPEIAESENLETEAAYKLAIFADELDAQVTYKAPAVTEDIEEYELKVAFERLDSLFLTIEESIKF